MAFAVALLSCGHRESPTNGGTPPSVVITSPAEGDTVSGVGFTLQGSASDDDAVSAIRLVARDTTFASQSTSPFSFYFPSILFNDAEDLTISVEAEDGEGATGSAEVRVYLRERVLRYIGSQADQEREPTWSPDGNTLAYASEGIGGNRDIYTVPADSGAWSQVTTSLNDDRSPAWAPWGGVLAFVSDRGGNDDIWTIASTGGAATQVTTNGRPDRDPTWSPSGAEIAFHSSRGGSWNVYSIPMSGGSGAGDATALTQAAFTESSATWRGDGGAIALVSNQNGAPDIWLVTPPSTVLSPLSGANDPFVQELDPAFSRIGRYLLFSDNRNLNFDLWVVDLETGRKKPVTSHYGHDREPAWAPAGNRIAFSSNRNGTYDIWILE